MPQQDRIVRPVEDRRFTGMVLVILAVACFTGIDVGAKWLIISGIPTAEVVFARYAVNLVLFMAVFLPLRGPALFATRHPTLEIVKALMLLGATVANFIAIRYLPLTVTGSIMFAMPLILPVMAIPLLGEHIGWRRWLAVAAGFIGVLTILQPGGVAFHWAALVSIAAMVFYALYTIATRKLAGIDPADTQQAYSVTIATAGVAPFLLFGWTWPGDLAGWLAFGLMGLCGAVGHLLLTVAYRLGPASVLAPFTYPQILFMAAASWFVFGEAPDAAVYAGAPIIVGAGLYLWLREGQIAPR